GQTTSAARLMIFMNWRSRSSRAIAPKIRVPRGFLSASISTTALRSNLTYEPSVRRVWFRVRTMTHRTTSPALTSPPEEAFLTLAMIVSPRPAVRRLYIDALPPRTLMHITSLAPVLSATSSRVCIWIMGRTPLLCTGPRLGADGRNSSQFRRIGSRLTISRAAGRKGRAPVVRKGAPLRRAERPHPQPPALELGHRAGFHDLDHVAETRLVGLVVNVTDGPATHQLAVLGVRDQALDHDPARLVHLVRRHGPDFRLAAAAGWRGLGAGCAFRAHCTGSRLASGPDGWNFPTNWLVGGRSRERSLPLDLAEPQDRLDPGDLALG